MRSPVAFLLGIAFLFGFGAQDCFCGRIDRIHVGMTRTDVAIELGRPAEVRVEQEAVLWIYPSSETEVCTIKFVKQKVVPEPVKCDASESSREFAQHTSYLLRTMNSEVEYQGRVQRYCGIKPKPRPGCRISEFCTNGEWGEVCQ
jgi:hypothetical protein